MNKINARRPEAVQEVRPRALVAGFIQAGEFNAADAGESFEINLYDEIGYYGVSAGDFKSALRQAGGKPLSLNINSPGGDVFDGIAIYNDLLGYAGKVSVSVTGVAASAASIVAMAGDEISIADNAFLMIHNAWSVVIGNKSALREFAEVLGLIDDALAGTYAARTGMSAEEIAQMLDAETWLSAEAAVELGFADARQGKAAAALYDYSAYTKTPAALKRSVEAGLREAGYSKNQALVATANGFDSLRDAGDRARRDAEAAAIWGQMIQSMRTPFAS